MEKRFLTTPHPDIELGFKRNSFDKSFNVSVEKI
jgi:hypothetical protein